MSCFCLGRVKAEHLVTHRYKVIDSLKFPLFVADWTAREEKLLLDGVLKYGYGNWGTIHDHLGSTKTPRQCELHFRQIYMANAQVPVMSERNSSGFVTERSCETTKLPSMDIDDVIFPLAKQEPEKHALMEFAGYMPLRRDFEIEHDNDFELYLSSLEFYDDEPEEDRMTKFRKLDTYNDLLDDREERKSFVIDRWPSELRSEKLFKGDVLRRNIYHAMKPYARYLPSDKHVRLCEALSEEYILRMKLEELKEAKRQGLSTQAEFKMFLQERRNNNPARQKEYDTLLRH